MITDFPGTVGPPAQGRLIRRAEPLSLLFTLGCHDLPRCVASPRSVQRRAGACVFRDGAGRRIGGIIGASRPPTAERKRGRSTMRARALYLAAAVGVVAALLTIPGPAG